MTTNKISVGFSQHIPAYQKENGETVAERNYSFEASDETKREIKAEHAGNFFMLQFLKFLDLEKLQGHDTFKASRDIIVTVKVNDKEGQAAMKVSMTRARFDKTMEKAPRMLANIFTKISNVASLTDSETKKFMQVLPKITDEAGETVQAERIAFAAKNTVLAKAIKEDAPAVEPVPELN